MKITRKVFINKANGQASITLPSSILKKIQEDLKLNRLPKEVSLDINPSLKGIKNGNFTRN